MKKVLSFCLWGDNPTYNIGAIRNSEIAKSLYPDFECWFYIHKETVPIKTIEKLEKMDNTKVIFKYGDLNTSKPMMWRFEAIDDNEVELMMCRDTDTRILFREKLAVDEWLNSNKVFHIMRDHPHHRFHVLGGMFGTKKIPEISSWASLMKKVVQNKNRDYDQEFLYCYIYNNIKDNSVIHATFHKHEPHSKDFPIKYDNDYRFVGEYVYFDESRSNVHIDILKKSVNNK